MYVSSECNIPCGTYVLLEYKQSNSIVFFPNVREDIIRLVHTLLR